MANILLSVTENTEKKLVTLTVAYDGRSGGGKKVYTVGAAVYEKAGSPVPGDEIDENTILELGRSVTRREAIASALRILSFGDNNRAMLRRKLIERGYTEHIADYAVERMIERGYIRERDQIERLAVGYAKTKLWGKKRILLHLLSKGYEESDVREALKSLEDAGDIDFEENFNRLVLEVAGSNATYEELRELKYKYGYND